MYSNIHNLTTGDVWFFSNHDPGLIVNTNIREMLSRGKRSYTFSDLRSLVKDRVQAEKPVLIAVDLDEQLMQKYCGSYYNSFSGRIEVQREGGVLEFSFADGSSEVFYAQTANRFFVPEEEAIVEFEEDETGKQMTLNLYENGFWVFKAWKKSLD